MINLILDELRVVRVKNRYERGRTRCRKFT